MDTPVSKNCSVCHAVFTCGPDSAQQACWCTEFPPVMPADFDQDCRCPACLGQTIDARIKASLQTQGIASMVDMARLFFNPDTLVEHVDYTIENGSYVFSAWYHLKRGSCCGNGCRNCPYNSGNA